MEAITNEDVRACFPKVPHIDKTLIEQDADSVRNWLVLFGIRDRRQLDRFVAAKEVFDYLAKVYESELGRPSAAPLDPTAVAVWGVFLFTRGLGDDVKNEIIRKIRESDEYRRKHASEEISA